MRNSPCARLMTRIMPKTMASPRLTSSSEAIPVSAWMPVARTASIGRSGPDVDHHLLVGVRLLLQVADRLRVGRRRLREGLQHLEAPVLHLGDEDVEGGMMGLRVERGQAGRAGEADAALERLDHLHPVD